MALTLYMKRKIWITKIVPMLTGNDLGLTDPTQWEVTTSWFLSHVSQEWDTACPMASVSASTYDLLETWEAEARGSTAGGEVPTCSLMGFKCNNSAIWLVQPRLRSSVTSQQSEGISESLQGLATVMIFTWYWIKCFTELQTDWLS